MACAGSSGTDIRGDAKLQTLPMEPKISQATMRTRRGDGGMRRGPAVLILGMGKERVEYGMIALRILGGGLCRG
ncbi:hypothetical protein NicSoilC5_13030 [Arthrobacter sp. NicSoilC5]|nr:hypothetical protein NicSoilC5_13030 [Arthrobacter sp. NicSoilC5]